MSRIKFNLKDKDVFQKDQEQAGAPAEGGLRRGLQYLRKDGIQPSGAAVG